MSEWLSVSDAASVMGVSARTVERMITKGQLQNELRHGRRMVWVQRPDTESDIESVIEVGADRLITLTDRLSVTLSEPDRAGGRGVAVIDHRG